MPATRRPVAGLASADPRGTVQPDPARMGPLNGRPTPGIGEGTGSAEQGCRNRGRCPTPRLCRPGQHLAVPGTLQRAEHHPRPRRQQRQQPGPVSAEGRRPDAEQPAQTGGVAYQQGRGGHRGSDQGGAGQHQGQHGHRRCQVQPPPTWPDDRRRPLQCRIRADQTGSGRDHADRGRQDGYRSMEPRVLSTWIRSCPPHASAAARAAMTRRRCSSGGSCRSKSHACRACPAA